MTVVTENKMTFSPAQYEIINLMSSLDGESDYVELKSVLVRFLDSRIQAEIDRLYDDGRLSDEKMADLGRQHLRTAYGTHA